MPVIDATLIDAILGLVALEAVGLAALHRLTGRGPALSGMAGNLAAGACLLLALRAVLLSQPTSAVGAWLALSLMAHLVDLAQRWQTA